MPVQCCKKHIDVPNVVLNLFEVNKKDNELRRLNIFLISLLLNLNA